MSVITESSRTELYRRGVDCLLEERIEEAVRLLTPAASEGMAVARLALGRAHLQQDDGVRAAEQFDALLRDPPADTGMRSYLHLLAACAAALRGLAHEATEHLDAAQSHDPRFEHAVRALRRRLQKGRRPVARL